MSDDNETTGGSTSFTPAESKLLISIMANLQGDLNVSDLYIHSARHQIENFPIRHRSPNNAQADWATVATENNYKDASIAKTRWGQIRRKKIANGSPKGANAGVTKAPAKKGRAAGSPKAKGGKGKSKKAVASEDDEDSADVEDMVKVKAETENEEVVVKTEEAEGGAEAEDGELAGHGQE